jgi:polysaccharide biosynthesis/export protein
VATGSRLNQTEEFVAISVQPAETAAHRSACPWSPSIVPEWVRRVISAVPDALQSRALLAAAAITLFAGCSGLQMPVAGPHTDTVIDSLAVPTAAGAVQIVNVDAQITRTLVSRLKQSSFADTLGNPPAGNKATVIGAGDALDVTLWEAPPATLFGMGPVDPRMPSTVRSTTMPEQVVDRDGNIRVPFAGVISVLGRTPQEVQADIVKNLKGKANQPDALVRVVRNGSSMVTVVGEVASSVRLPLTPGGERLLDALAAAGGVRQPVNKTTLQVTRGSDYSSMPLDAVIRDPRQNVRLQGGDVITAIFQSLSFTALGATGKNEEVPFEVQGITLAQALARAGGLNDARSDPKGVFIFRFESPDALDWPLQPVKATPEGKVPVVYRVNLLNAESFFVMQSFRMQDRDVMYVSNAPAAELQKFLNLVFSVTWPVLNTIQLLQ